MELGTFITGLLNDGTVVVPEEIIPFKQEELEEAGKILQELYEFKLADAPANAPSFSAKAALWAASYLYRTIQFILCRDLGEEKIEEHLIEFEGEKDARAVYSADLMLNYLHDLIRLSKNLSPDDPLVLKLQKTAADWPFSSAGTQIDADANFDIILNDPCLKILFADRIILTKDLIKARILVLQPIIGEVLGNYSAEIWPEAAN